MKRLLAFVATLLLAAPAAAQVKPPWVGLWEGRVGSYPVRACFELWGDDLPGRGSYYYLSRLTPIALSDEEGEGGWTEQAPEGEAAAKWSFAEHGPTLLRGTWTQGGRTLSFELTPIAWSKGEWGGPCASDEYLAPRLAPPATDAAPAELGGWRYTVRRYRPPSQFAETVAIETFAFASERPGDPAINRVLAAYLPAGSVNDDFVQCFAGALAAHGVDGYFEQSVAPKLVSGAFLTVHEANSSYCGGARPSHWFHSRAFDRASGREIDLFDWIGPPRPADRGSSDELPLELLEAVLAHWSNDPQTEADGDAGECRETVEGTAFWDLELREAGIAFWPDVPHAALPCRIESVLDWRTLAPFLDEDGKAGLARLRGE